MRQGRWLVVMLVLSPGPLLAQESYGFVTRLGNDTIAVERVKRSADRIVSDEVDRFPRVTRHRTDVQLGPDHRITRAVMVVELPTATTPEWQRRTVTAVYGRDSVRVVFANGKGTQTLVFPTGGQPVVPWSPQQYSLTELYFDQALDQPGDSVFIRTFYPDMQAEDYSSLPKGRILGGWARRLPGGKMEVFRHDALAGAGEGTLDGQGRMISYSGTRSTYKVEVVRTSTPPDVESVARAMTALERRDGVAADLSLRDTSRATIGSAQFAIDYGRPLVRGRTLVGNVIPYGQVWRTGANAATQFTTSSPITLAGLELAAGTYTLWSVPESSGVVLIVNRQHGQWGTQYDPTKDLGRAPLAVERTGQPVEKLTLSVVPSDSRHGTMVIAWGDFRWSAPVLVK